MLTEKDVPENLQKIDGAYIDKIFSCNHKPHPFTIGPRHVTHAADKCGGLLGEETLRAIPCAFGGWGGCNSTYDEHVYDTVAAIRLTRDINQSEIKPWLMAIGEVMKDKGLDGFVFIEGFKILNG